MTTRTRSTSTVGSGTELVTYDVHGDLADATPDRPVLLAVGSPMAADGFGTLAAHFTDRPVVTYDPRGAGRNPAGTTGLTPEQHAEDLHTVVRALDAGPVDVFATSGGAVNALALATAHPDDLRRVVAHEPPTAALLPDRDALLAACRAVRATYDQQGHGAAMARFIALVMVEGELGEDHLRAPAPDPAAFGLPTQDDGSRTDPLMRNIPACNAYEPDLAALGALGTRLVLAAGVESGQQFAARGARSVAAALGTAVATFPSHHGGFLGGEFGQHGQPEAFAAALREVLDR